MRYALVWVLLAFGAGIGLGRLVLGVATAWVPLAAAGLLSVFALVVPRARSWLLLTAVVLLGCARLLAADGEVPGWLRLRAAGLESVTGTVTSYPSVGAGHITFTLQPDQLPMAVRVTWFPDVEPAGLLHYGNRITVRGVGRLPESFDGFDYPRYLSDRGIFATLLADGDKAVTFLDGPRNGILRAGDRIRQSILSALRKSLGSSISGVAQGILFGDRAALPDEVEAAFRRTGLMHVLAVSGLHLGILLAGAWFLLRRASVRPAAAYPLVGLLALLFLWIVGTRVSLLRATLLLAFVGLGSVLADLGVILRRSVRPLNGLAAAGIVLLAVRPMDLADAGFQLTFSATAGILLLSTDSIREAWAAWVDQVAARVPRGSAFVRRALSFLLISVGAQAAVVPVVAWHFGTFHPLLLGLNLAVIPLVTLVLWIGFPSVLLLGLGVPGFVGLPFGWGLRALTATVAGLSGIPGAELAVSKGLAVWAAAVVGFLALSFRYRSGSS